MLYFIKDFVIGGIMREQLLAMILLARAGFVNISVYHNLLNSCYAIDSDNHLLCELQWASNKTDDSVNLLLQSGAFNKTIFIKTILKTLKNIYDEDKFSLNDFTKHCYILWSSLPLVRDEKPLNAFCYLIDYRDEKMCREFLNDIFSYLK